MSATDLQAQLARAAAAWLADLRERLAEAVRTGRLPHAILLLGPEGAGQAELACWLAGLLLCERDARAACGDCVSCRLFLAGTHPDCHWVGIEADASAIRVEQIRDLAGSLETRSFRGHCKVVVIDPADSMNISSFNALLKTLEEPSEDTYLLLTASRRDRLPATIRSRCSCQRLPLPAPAQAVAWLQLQQPRDGWPRLLELAQGAPFLALDYASAGLEELDADMQKALGSPGKVPFDVLGLADAWRADRPEVRLAWLELWLTELLREAAGPSDAVNNNRRYRLPAGGDRTIISRGYRLLDALREARGRIGGSLNVQLLFENLLVDLAEWMRSNSWRAHSNQSRT